MPQLISANCINCSTSLNVASVANDVSCPSCGSIFPAKKVATALTLLFCAASQPRDRYAYELLQILTKAPWGNGLIVGRVDWVVAGCPVTPSQLADAVLKGNEAVIIAVSRFWTAGNTSLAFKKSHVGVSKAAVEKLKTGVSDMYIRERLYRLIEKWPYPEAIPTLEELRSKYLNVDGNPSDVIGSVLASAINECHICTLPDDEQEKLRTEFTRQFLREELG